MSLGSCGACMSVCVGVCWCVCVVVCVRGENGSQESTPRIDLRDSPHWFLSSPPICFLVRWINRHASCESCGSRREERGGSENCVVNEYVIIPFSLCTTNAAQSAPLCFISVRCFKRNWEFSRFHKKVLRRKCESQICVGGEAGLQPWYTTVGCSSCTRWRFTNQFFLIITRWILPVFESCFFLCPQLITFAAHRQQRAASSLCARQLCASQQQTDAWNLQDTNLLQAARWWRPNQSWR